MNPFSKISIVKASDIVELEKLEKELDQLLDYMLSTNPRNIPEGKTDRLVWLEQRIDFLKQRSKL